ncbi:MAG TPA: ferritin-like domain-containing protein [Candidatus Kapabacteria bacterium]
MPNWFIDRYLRVLLSVYLYNEHRGYTELERLARALREKYPSEHEFIAAVEKHTEDERKHYLMFRHYFESRGEMPLAVGSSSGYIDRLVSSIFGADIDDLNPEEMVADDEKFFRLCRLIMITEFRGMKQVETILNSLLIRGNDELQRVFKIIERDEPSHWQPYEKWLRTHGSNEPSFREKAADVVTHYMLVTIKLPLLFCNPFGKRLTKFPA